MSEEVRANWYFTFCIGDHLGRGNNYAKFNGTYMEARAQMMESFGDRWAFQYAESEFLKQITQYGLTEVDYNDSTN